MVKLNSRLARSRLTVSEQCAVVSHYNFVQHGTEYFVVYQCLVCLWTKYKIEWICFDGGKGDNTQISVRMSCFNGKFFALRAGGGYDYGRVVGYFTFGAAPATDNDLNVGVCSIDRFS